MSISPRNARKVVRAQFHLVAVAAAVAASLLCALAWPVEGTRAQDTTGSPDIVISQVYTRGGEAGAAFQNDFIELFNRGTASVNINGYSFQVTSTTGSSTTATSVSFVSTRNITVEPGQYFLFKLAGGANGQPLPVSENLSIQTLNLGSTSGKIAIVRNSDLASGECPVGQDADIADYVGYGPANCFEGVGPASAPTLTNAVYRKNDGCTDTDNNAADFNAAAPNPRNTSSPKHVCAVGSGASIVQFTETSYKVSESATHLDVTVTRSGDTASAVSVDYATVDGTAIERQDYTTALGTLRFAPGETTKTIRILLTDDGYPEGGDESFQLVLANPGAGVSLPAPIAPITINDNDTFTPPSNPIDNAEFFVRQHYHDFFNREPDAPGLAFWTNQLTECATPACLEVRRINVSAAFFLSPEFQETGFFVLRARNVAFGRRSDDPATRVRYRDFIREARQVGEGVVSGEAGFEQKLAQNKQAYAEQVVTEAAYVQRFPTTLSASEYVNALFTAAGVTSPTSAEVNDALNAYGAGGTTGRAAAFIKVVDANSVRQREFGPAFVLMEYFGYMRRNPTDAPDNSDAGYQFWLAKLNQFGGNYINAEMVKAFITSGEYRGHFGAQ
jgi:hypothetical protein